MSENIWGAYQDDQDQSLKIKAYDGFVFGLNQKVLLTRVEFSTLTGSGGTEGEPALLIFFKQGEAEINTRIYKPGNKVYYGGKEYTDKNNENYKKGLAEAIKSIKAFFTHLLKSVDRTSDEITTAISSATSFESLAKIVSTLCTDAINSKKPLDIFLHYQANIKGSADKTYLEIPTSLNFGSFFNSHIVPVGEWKEEREWEEEGKKVKGLRYVDNNNNVHRFTRDENYTKSKRANQQTSTSSSTMNSIDSIDSNTPESGEDW